MCLLMARVKLNLISPIHNRELCFFKLSCDSGSAPIENTTTTIYSRGYQRGFVFHVPLLTVYCSNAMYAHVICAHMCISPSCSRVWICMSKPKLLLQLLCGIHPDLQHVKKKKILPILRSKSLLSSASKHTKVGILQS